jgi:hypothetical protein
VLTEAGWTAADKRHAAWMNEFACMVGDEGFEEFLRERRRLGEAIDRSMQRAAARAVLRKQTKASQRPTGSDPYIDLLVAWLRKHGFPVTRERYLKMAYPTGVPEPWTAEHRSPRPARSRRQCR